MVCLLKRRFPYTILHVVHLLPWVERGNCAFGPLYSRSHLGTSRGFRELHLNVRFVGDCFPLAEASGNCRSLPAQTLNPKPQIPPSQRTYSTNVPRQSELIKDLLWGLKILQACDCIISALAAPLASPHAGPGT